MIVVMVRWGRGARVLPDETALVVARFLVSLGVTLIIGDHPVLQQSHAYFEDTLIVFSPGSFCRPSLSLNLCWRQVSSRPLRQAQGPQLCLSAERGGGGAGVFLQRALPGPPPQAPPQPTHQ